MSAYRLVRLASLMLVIAAYPVAAAWGCEVLGVFRLADWLAPPAAGSRGTLVHNGGFEEVASGEVPVGWQFDAWRKGAVLRADSTVARTGKMSLLIACKSRNDARAVQEVQLEPHSVYRLSAWVKTEGVRVVEDQSDPGARLGANIGLYGTLVHSEDIEGTEDWTRISTVIFTLEQPRVSIACRLGFWWSTAVGKAWFDDVRLTRIPMCRISVNDPRMRRRLEQAAEKMGYASIEGKHVIVRLRAKKWLWLSKPGEWVRQLDRAYEAYAELVGAVPFGGKKAVIVEVEDYPHGLAVAGRPILWHGRAIDRPTFRRIEAGDWQFGMLHELGHIFDLDGRWVWHGEFFANFKMVYVLDACRAKVWHWGKWYDHARSEGPRIDDFYRNRAAEMGQEKAIDPKDWPDGATDPDTYHFCALKQIIGWEPFKKTFRAFLAMPPDRVPSTPVEKYREFVRLLSRFSGMDCASWLASRGFPPAAQKGK